MLAYNVATKSSFSVQNCVVVTVRDNGDVEVGSSRDQSARIRYTEGEWSAFVQGVKASEFDHPAVG
ncbi:DUF397 domain-containing protein [Pseudonocardia sp. GCM10023141]|uniref:DUF397 domain-containing protein n=1 Tax=Pseudonocardia sp. GCM10023141 TaxID=3252653 RepID=UPI003622DA15